MFNILRGWFEGATVVDLFSGVGTMGLEAISRGAREVVFVERDRTTAMLLARNIERLGVQSRARIVTGDAFSGSTLASLPHGTAQVAFVDPPYPLMEGEEADDVLNLLERVGRDVMDPKGFIILRTSWPYKHGKLLVKGLAGPETHVYGSMAVHLYQPSESRGTGDTGTAVQSEKEEALLDE